jgi:hypothetical protein
MAMYKAECGKDSCLCSFLFLDFELVKAWLNTAREYAGYAMKPHKDIVCKQLLQPWKLTTLKEHDVCFQQWSILQLWIGIITTLVIAVIHFIWFITEDNVPFGAIIVNAIFRLALSVFFAHLVWFGVVNKHGCCCFLMCCCEGFPNLLVVSVLSVIFGISALITALQAVFSGFLLAILGAVFATAHGLSMFYLGFEAFMVWRHSTSGDATTADMSVVGQAKDQSGKVVGQAEVVGVAAAIEVQVANAANAADATDNIKAEV